QGPQLPQELARRAALENRRRADLAGEPRPHLGQGRGRPRWQGRLRPLVDERRGPGGLQRRRALRHRAQREVEGADGRRAPPGLGIFVELPRRRGADALRHGPARLRRRDPRPGRRQRHRRRRAHHQGPLRPRGHARLHHQRQARARPAGRRRDHRARAGDLRHRELRHQDPLALRRPDDAGLRRPGRRQGGAERQPQCHPDGGARQALVGHRVEVRPAVPEEVPARRRMGARGGEGLDRSISTLRLGLALALALPALASADALALHERVAAPAKSQGRIVRGPASPAGEGKPPGSQNPTAIRQDEKIIAAPSVSQPPTGSEVVHGQRSFAADRETEAHLDYATQQDGTLHYVEVFNPSIVPFKRMSALHRVRGDDALEGAGRALRAISVGAQTSADRDLFWGSLVIDLPEGGTQVPIPSVAPDMRILSYEVQPRARLVFARDGADNFYLRAEDGARGQHRVVILVDAPAAYFAPKVPTGIPLRDVARRRPPLPLPERVRASATTILARLRISPELSADRAVSRLVDYFRGFEPGAPPTPSGDIYLDLALARKGVCRHRAFAFMITANAAGIPTRYVTNEAHAFAEIWMPGPGWLRIDLGGAALELDIANEGDKTMYRPRSEDPFPKPKAYA